METKPQHSPIGASSYYRWQKNACPGSVKLSKGLPNIQSKYAEEGTLAHKVASTFLDDGIWLPESDQEMRDYLSIYIDCVTEDWKKAHKVPAARLFVEQGFHLNTIHKDLYGTADAVIYDHLARTLRVYDLKYGQGLIVEVENNEQLMYYGLGALLEIQKSGLTVNEVELIIVQPRAPHDDGQVRRWKFSTIELIEFKADLLESALETEKENAALRSGGHCRFCPAAGICPELAKKAQAIARIEFPVIEPEIVPIYDAEILAKTLEAIPLLKTYIESVHEFAYNEACAGRIPPRFKLVQKRPTRKWYNIEEVEKVLTQIESIDKAKLYDISLKSPAQIEKILPKNINLNIDELCLKESSGNTLVPIGDKREAISVTPKLDAKRAFLIEDILS